MRFINERATASRAWRVALVAMLLTIGIVGSVVGASAQAADTIYACQSRYTNQIRIIQPGQNCVVNEVRLEFQSAAGADDQQDQIDALAARVAALEGRMDTAEGDIDAVEDRATALEGRMDTAEGDIDAVEGRMDTAEGDIDALEGRMDTAEGDIDSLETRMTTAEGNITTLDTRVTNIRNFFTGVANNIRGCFTGPGATFAITIPELAVPEIDFEIFTFPRIVIIPQTIIGFPVFNATNVVSCLNGITTSTTQ